MQKKVQPETKNKYLEIQSEDSRRALTWTRN